MNRTPRIYREDIVESEIPGCYTNPEKTRYAVSKNGVFYDTVKRLVFRPGAQCPEDIYPREETRYAFITVEVDGVKRVRPVHVYMAEMFLVKPSGKCIVNHIDGMKHNYRLENLEWASYTENIVHAFEEGLRSDNMRLLSVNIVTGEEKQFFSINDCGKHYGINPARIQRMLSSGKKWLQVPNTIIVKAKDGLPSKEDYHLWTEYKIAKTILVHKDGEDTARLVTSVRLCSEHTGISFHYIRDNMRPILSNILRKNGFTLMANDEIVKFEKRHPEIKIVDMRKDNSHFVVPNENLGTKPRAVLVTNLETGETTRYLSLKDFCEKNGYRTDTVMKNIYKNAGRLTTTNLHIAYELSPSR